MPKLTAICCTVLAMVLAPLACSLLTSAYASVFMLVYCVEVKKPNSRTRAQRSASRRAHVDQGEQHQHHAEHHGVRDQHLPVAEIPQDDGQREFEADRGERLRHDHESGLDRRESESHLIQKRQQEGQSADAEPGEQVAR